MAGRALCLGHFSIAGVGRFCRAPKPNRRRRSCSAISGRWLRPTFLTFRTLYCIFVIEHGRRKILHCNFTEYPTVEWAIQQLREAFPEAGPYR